MGENDVQGCMYGVILAGGTGSRMGSDIPKQFLMLDGKPLLQYSIEAFDASEADGFIIVVNDIYRERCEDMIRIAGTEKFAGFAPNGSERVWSVKNGLDKVKDVCKEDGNVCVLIHDGARPMITPELINECIRTVRTTGACVPAVELKDTVKLVGDDMYVRDTPDRSMLRAVQTPQCFDLNVILDAYDGYESARNGAEDFVPTDDASLVERFSKTRVLLIPGDENNIKVTTPVDMERLRGRGFSSSSN